MKIHNLKLRIEFADAVLDGTKPFEIRVNDRGYQKGDIIKYEVVDRMGLNMPHSVENHEYEITYILHGWGLKDDWCVFGTRDVTDLNGKKHAETGKWLRVDPGVTLGTDKYICSKCREEPWWCGVTEDVLPKYCPNCGAPMQPFVSNE